MHTTKPNALSAKILIAVLVVVGVATALMFHFKSDQDLFGEAHAVRTDSQLALVGSTRLWSGSNGEFVNYDLRSFDGGESWVSVEYDDAGRLKILGDVEALYPGLVAAIQHGRFLAEIVTTVGKKA